MWELAAWVLLGGALTAGMLEVVARVGARLTGDFQCLDLERLNRRYLVHPLLGYIYRPNYRDESIRVNRLGFRGTRLSLRRPAGGYRMLALGDSVIFGWQSREEETFPVFLERSLSARLGGAPVEVLNGGVRGYTSANVLALVLAEARYLKTDAAIVLVGWNDVNINVFLGQVPPGMSAWQERLAGMSLGHYLSVVYRHSALLQSCYLQLRYLRARVGGRRTSLVGRASYELKPGRSAETVRGCATSREAATILERLEVGRRVYGRNLRRTVELLRRSGKSVVLLTMPSVLTVVSAEDVAEKIARTNGRFAPLRELPAELTVTELAHALRAFNDEICAAATDTGAVLVDAVRCFSVDDCDHCFSDIVSHLTVEGCQRLADAVAAALVEGPGYALQGAR